MICWKCDGDHLAANCPRWPGFEYPPERTPPHLRMRLDQAMSRDAQMKAMERIGASIAPPPTHESTVIAGLRDTLAQADSLAPPGECPYCDRRRANKHANRQGKRRGSAANGPSSTLTVSASEPNGAVESTAVSASEPNKRAPRGTFDRKAYQRELMRKRRAKLRGEA